MKNYYLTTIFLIATASIATAQVGFEGYAKFGYMLNGGVQFSEGTFDFKNTPSFSVAMGTNTRTMRDVEIEYTYGTNSQASFQPNKYGSNSYGKFKANTGIHYILANGINYLNQGKVVRPYCIAGLGAVVFDVKDSNKSRTFFGFNFGFGVKYDLNERVGLRFQGRLMTPVLLRGGGIFFGSGGYSGFTVETVVPMAQGEFSGGLTFRL